jgi:hypothetical protein
MLLLTFWRTDRSRVPLYLTNRSTADSLATLLLPATPVTVIDLGCGDGGLLRRLALARPDCRFVGLRACAATLGHGPASPAADCPMSRSVRQFLAASAGRLRAGLWLSLARPDAAPVGQGQGIEMKPGALAGQQQLRNTWHPATSTEEVADAVASTATCRPLRDGSPRSGIPGAQNAVPATGPGQSAEYRPGLGGRGHKPGDCLAFSAIEGDWHAQ